jgi:hypothetical protein
MMTLALTSSSRARSLMRIWAVLDIQSYSSFSFSAGSPAVAAAVSPGSASG